MIGLGDVIHTRGDISRCISKVERNGRRTGDDVSFSSLFFLCEKGDFVVQAQNGRLILSDLSLACIVSEGYPLTARFFQLLLQCH